MRKKTFKLSIRCKETPAVLYTPAVDIKQAVAEFNDSEFNDWELVGVKAVEGIILWKGKTQ